MSTEINLRLAVRPFACLRCQIRQRSRILPLGGPRPNRRSSSFTKSSSTAGYFPPPADLSQPAYAQLTHRSIIRLQGPDVVDFLNGLLPARLQPLQTHPAPIFTTFLSAKGRIIHEVFIYAPVDSDPDGPWYIETESSSLSALFSHLKKHKLRSKFKLEKIAQDELGVYYVWPSQETTGAIASNALGRDPRPLMGKRFLSSSAKPSQTLTSLMEEGRALSIDDYRIHRMLTGHAEGPDELIPTSSLPQESNIDFDGGIDFHKGCYLGQELTIRTHHTGVVRKRILPCQLGPGNQSLSVNQEVPIYDSSIAVHQPPREANISKMHAKGRAGRSTGKWLGGVGNIGLALCRLEMMTDIQLTAEATNFDPDGEFSIVWEESEADAEGKSALREVKVKPFVPQWLRDSIQAEFQARSQRSKRRKQEEDDEDLLD